MLENYLVMYSWGHHSLGIFLYVIQITPSTILQYYDVFFGLKQQIQQ